MKTLLLLLKAIFFNKPVSVRSPTFKNNASIPDRYTFTNASINRPLTIANISEGSKSLALLVDYPDATNGTLVHWVMWNIPVDAAIVGNSSAGPQGKNEKGANQYMGPCPPSGTHHYNFKFFARNAKLELAEGSDKHSLLKAAGKPILASGGLIGLYKK